MKHAADLDHVEASPQRADFEDIGLRIFDIGETERARLADRVTKAGAAEIDREHARARKALRRLDRVLAGAAAGDANVEAAEREGGAERRRWKLTAQVPIDRHGWAHRPARVGHVLILALNLARDGVLDGRERGDC